MALVEVQERKVISIILDDDDPAPHETVAMIVENYRSTNKLSIGRVDIVITPTTVVASDDVAVKPDFTLTPEHPGKVLKKDFLTILGLSVTDLAADIRYPPQQLQDFVDGKISLDRALAEGLGKTLYTGDTFWLNLQSTYDQELKALNSKCLTEPQDSSVEQ